MSERYLAEFRPQYRLQFEEPAPLATKCIFLSPYGSAVVGNWYEGCKFIAWSPMPTLTAEQKEKIERYLRDSGVQESESGEGC